MVSRAPRVPPLPRAEWTDAARDVFAYWEGDEARENGSRSNTMLTLAQHPALAIASLNMGRYFMLESTLDGRQLKIIMLRVAHRYGSTYQWTHNVAAALQMGMTAGEIAGLQEGGGAAVWSDADAAMLRAVDATCDGGLIGDALWRELEAHYSRRQIMDLVHATGYFTMVAWGLVTMGVELEEDMSFSRNRAKG